jgi:hypothetical protein
MTKLNHHRQQSKIIEQWKTELIKWVKMLKSWGNENKMLSKWETKKKEEMNKHNLPRNKRGKERRSNCFESDDWRNYGQENGGQFSKQTEILRETVE